eukprot:1617130-Alexandrium_andersonii.AAC.1
MSWVSRRSSALVRATWAEASVPDGATACGWVAAGARPLTSWLSARVKSARWGPWLVGPPATVGRAKAFRASCRSHGRGALSPS